MVDLMGLVRAYPEMPDNGGFIFEAVKEGMWPFKARNITIEMMQPRDFPFDIIRIKVHGLPRVYTYPHVFDRDEWYNLFYPEAMLIRDVAEAAFNYYRHIPRVEPEPNIELGEN